MRQIWLEKFPVISPKGNTYHVVIDDDNCFDILHCRLYVEVAGWFGRKKLREVFFDADMHRKYTVRYKELAERTVIRYERKLERDAAEKRSHEFAVGKFEGWDGKVAADENGGIEKGAEIDVF